MDSIFLSSEVSTESGVGRVSTKQAGSIQLFMWVKPEKEGKL